MKILRLLWVLVGLLWAGQLWAAEPFSAPAQFNLAGSTIELEITVTHDRLGSYDMEIEPNPVPVTGFIDIDKLSVLTGACQGQLRNVSATTHAEFDRWGIEMAYDFQFSLNADPLNGVFFWSKNKAAFYPENVVLTVASGGQTWNIPLNGIPLPADYVNGVLTLEAELDYTEEYEGYQTDAHIGLHLVGNLEDQVPVGDNGISIALALDKNVYQTADRLELRAGISNDGPQREVDIYLAYFDPLDNFFIAPEYNSRLQFLARATLAARQYVPLTKVLDVGLPAHSPPIVVAGESYFCAVVTAVGSFEPLSNWAFADFTYNAAPSSSAPFDGEWYGSGGSAVPGGDCPPLASVQVTVVDGQISGEASEMVEIDVDGYKMTGSINAQGEIVDGILLEEYMTSWIPVGSFSGTFSGSHCDGTWMDEYGCYGTFTLDKMDY